MSRQIDRVTDLFGHPIAVVLAAASVSAWLLTGPLLHFSDRWQAAIQTAAAIVTFLMIFCVQHTQSKDDAAMQAKLDELIRAISAARNELIGIERGDRDDVEDARARSAP